MRSETVTTVVDAPQSEVFAYMADKVVNGLGEFYFDIRADEDSESTGGTVAIRAAWRGKTRDRRIPGPG